MVANVVAIGRPILMSNKILKINVPNGFGNFCYLAANMYGYVCLAGSRKYVCSVIIMEQDSAFVFSLIYLWMMFS